MQQKYLQREYSWARVLSFDTGKTFVTQHPEGGIKEHSCMQREYFWRGPFCLTLEENVWTQHS